MRKEMVHKQHDKEPWQMTQREYVKYGTSSRSEKIRKQYRDGHRKVIERALSENKPVPNVVLKDYPDLAPSDSPKKASKYPYRLDPDEIAAAYIKQHLTETMGSSDIAAVQNYAYKSIRPLAINVASGNWRSVRELTGATSPANQQKRAAKTAKDLDWLISIGYAQVAWSSHGDSYYARADVPLQKGLTQESAEEIESRYHIILNRIAKEPAADRVVSRRGGWLVKDLENPAQLIPPVPFKTKKEAIDWAGRNAQAVLERYKDLIPILETEKKPTPKPKRKRKPLPQDAVNVQQLTFDSELFTCYGKPVRKGYRAYCRKEG